MQYDVFIKSTDQELFTAQELKEMEENTGINMLSPYFFINNLLYDATIDQ